MRLAMGLALGVILVPVSFIALDGFGLNDLIPNGLLFPIVWLCLACVYLCHRSAKRALRRAAAHDHLLCPDCLYDLRNLDATGTCPECGRASEHDAVRAQWVDAERRLIRK